MKIYPAMDLLDGKVVRLYRGKRDRMKVYGDPLEIALELSKYFDKVHIIDLNGAFEGEQKNMDLIKKVMEETKLRVQLGGGFRDYRSVERAYRMGVENVIIGTKALDLDFVRILSRDFDGITVSLDSVKGRFGKLGWVNSENASVVELFMKLRGMVRRFIYTITEKDGTLSGLSENDVRRFWEDEEFIYAGGITKMEDLILLEKIGFSGAVVGKALYERKLDLEELGKFDGSSLRS